MEVGRRAVVGNVLIKSEMAFKSDSLHRLEQRTRNLEGSWTEKRLES